ncbi:MAG: fatty acyl-AMP ligase [Cyanophyceae cyanobacterium]
MVKFSVTKRVRSKVLNQYSTIVELVRDRARSQPGQTVYTFLADGETESGTLTYQELDRQAQAIAARLQTVVRPGDRVLVVYPYSAGLEFIAAFFGCLYAGAIAVTSHPPRHQKAVAGLQERAISSGAAAVLTTTPLLNGIQTSLASTASPLSQLPWIATDAPSASPDWVEPTLSSDIAFLQYTSGSTGTPKGVMVTHSNILHNSAVIQQCFEHTPESHVLMWLPLFHDMGLIGGVIQPLYVGFPMVLMSPIALTQKPWRWVQAISRYRITTSGGPNFAYDLSWRSSTPEQREQLDLSCWELAFSGAEPVRAETLEQFAATFAPCGFRSQALYPCYGMAESTLFITGGRKQAAPVIRHLDRKALERNQIMIASPGPKARAVVGCGRSWLGDRVIIVDPDSGTRCSSDRVGEIWVSGPGVGQGYWNQPQETAHTFSAYTADGAGPFLRTGDLGFFDDEELFITGRLKEVMIFWGNMRYPQHIELTAQASHPALRPNHGAAFSIEVAGEERLVIAQEVERTSLRQLNVEEVVGAIRQAVAEEHTVDPYAVLLLKPGSLPKTSSGKVQRRACRAQFLDGTLPAVAHWQEQQDHYDNILEMFSR